MPPKPMSNGKTTQAKLTSFFGQPAKKDASFTAVSNDNGSSLSCVDIETPPSLGRSGSRVSSASGTAISQQHKSEPPHGSRVDNESAFLAAVAKKPEMSSSKSLSGSKPGRNRVLESPESGDNVDLDPDFQNFQIESDSSPEDVPEVEEFESETNSEISAENECAFKTPLKRKRNGANGLSANKRKPAAVKPSRAGKPSKISTTGSALKRVPKIENQKMELDEADDGLSRDRLDNEEGADAGELMGKHTHELLSWLEPQNRRDKQGELHTVLIAQGVTPRTLKLASGFLDSKEVTPALRQWWKIKSDNFDCVLFFKLGKFYEMYHVDADTGVKELGLVYMRGNHAHCGFPEVGFSRFANKLVEKGYKVMRVEQTMTPEQLKELNDKSQKALPRDIIRIYTPGTQSVSTLECESLKSDETSADQSCLLVIAEKYRTGHDGAEEFEYGVCVLYPGPGSFLIGQFKEDRYHSRLRTLLAHHAPTEMLLERGRLSPSLVHILRCNCESATKEYLPSGSEFLDVKESLRILVENEYFGPVLEPQWPIALRNMLDLSGGESRPISKSDHELAIRAVGTCATYLRRCQVDFDMLSLKTFEVYLPADVHGSKSSKPFNKQMILDGTTLINLDIVPNGTGNADSSLLKKVDRCKTKFGKRLLKEWVVSPLYRISDIADRQLAIRDIASFRNDYDKQYASALKTMQTLPDMERLLTKIHIIGSLKRNKEHPESRAVMFEEKTYGKNKIKDLISTITSFRSVMRMILDLGKCLADAKSAGLRKCVNLIGEKNAQGYNGHFPDLRATLDHFEEAFDSRQAAEDGRIVPVPGVDNEYDDAKREERDILDQLDKYRLELSRKFRCKIEYFGRDKKRFQLEMPEDACTKMPQDFELKSTRKGFKRFWTKEIEKFIALLVLAEEKREAALKDCTRRVFEKFDDRYAEWSKAVKCVAVLDVLFCLEEYSSNLYPRCVPAFVEASEERRPFIAIRDGRHPLVVTTFSGGDFIPNDSYIGVGEPESSLNDGAVVLVTGPNMGGKSTLMRQIGLIAVLAQLGTNVPASFCEMTPVDRIFTRIGASDNLLAGESTFFVEMSETSSLLQHATIHSLVLIDELGRGTATFDGTAIAAAVLKDLATRISCRTLFSTHYHSLVERFGTTPGIKLGHLACLVENDNDEDPTQEKITFLYKFVAGACPKSYGFNVARLAGLSDQIVKRAHAKALEMERLMQLGKLQLEQ